MAKQYPADDLKNIPGVGPDMERHLKLLGIETISQLKGQDPEAMYARDCLQQGVPVDRCVLYVYRLAVYYASNEHHDPALLKWQNWKDRPPCP